jgi:hypothetical protein
MKISNHLMAAAIAGISLGAAYSGAAHAGDARGAASVLEKHACKGQNDCKGQGGCKTDTHACKGQNACKGQGGCHG